MSSAARDNVCFHLVAEELGAHLLSETDAVGTREWPPVVASERRETKRHPPSVSGTAESTPAGCIHLTKNVTRFKVIYLWSKKSQKFISMAQRHWHPAEWKRNPTECCGKQSNSFADENLATADFCAAPPKLVSFDCPQTTVSSFRRRKMRNDTLRTLPPTFSAKRLIRSNPTQKTFDRAFKELQNDVQDD